MPEISWLFPAFPARWRPDECCPHQNTQTAQVQNVQKVKSKYFQKSLVSLDRFFEVNSKGEGGNLPRACAKYLNWGGGGV